MAAETKTDNDAVVRQTTNATMFDDDMGEKAIPRVEHIDRFGARKSNNAVSSVRYLC